MKQSKQAREKSQEEFIKAQLKAMVPAKGPQFPHIPIKKTILFPHR